MKRKVILALLATMTLTVGSLGTVFATESNQGITIQTSESEEHTHTWGDAYYVKDADAVYSEPEWVVDKPAEYEQIKVIDKEAWDEPVYDTVNICFDCYEKGTIVDMDELYAQGGTAFDDHVMNHILNGEGGSYGEREIQVDTIHHPEEFHYENGDLISPEEGHWTESVLISPEKGHWEHACTDCGEIQDRDTGEVIKPGTITTPENPDTDKPGNNTGNTGEDTQKPGTSTGDNTQTSTGDNTQTSTGNNSQTTTDDKTQSGNENTSNTENTENKSEDQKQNENKEATTADSKEQDDTTVTVSTEKKAPKTGDSASLIYLATLAGSAVTGGTAFGLRRKFKK